MGWEFKSPLAHRRTPNGPRRSRLVVNASTTSLSQGGNRHPNPPVLPRYKCSSISEVYAYFNRQLLAQ